jgi:ketosteroid isomerase-like protein
MTSQPMSMTMLIRTPRRRRNVRPAAVSSGLSPALMLLIVVCSVLLRCPQALALPAPGHKGHDVKQQVEELEQQWRAAQLNGDVAAMDKLLSDDYIGISINGQVNTKAQQLERTSSRRVSLTRMDLNEMKVKLIGSIAIVTSRAEIEGTSDGESVKGTYRYTRVYQHLPTGVWKITSFEATRIPQATPSGRTTARAGNTNPN